jgi:hypothetical protein
MKFHLISLLIFCSTSYAFGQDHYSGKFSTGSNSTGWYILATIDVTPGGCCNSVNINAKVHYVNTGYYYQSEAVIRHRAGKTSNHDEAEWTYRNNGDGGEVLKYRNVGLFKYELWGKAISSYSHFYTEITVTKESTTLVTKVSHKNKSLIFREKE